MLDTAWYAGKIPESTLESLVMYAEHGIPTGGFLEAVLSNDLMGACGRADQHNRAALADICQFVYMEMPAPCHGSRERFREWVQQGGLTGAPR